LANPAANSHPQPKLAQIGVEEVAYLNDSLKYTAIFLPWHVIAFELYQIVAA